MIEVAAIAALLFAAVVVVELARWLTAQRRRVRMNRAMHELRRPIQSLALAIGGEGSDLAAAEGWFEQVRHALDDLDAEINGRPRPVTAAAVPLGELAAGLERRWRSQGVRVDSPPSGPVLTADGAALGAALDNLVSNALCHGGGPVSVRAFAAPGVARFEVRDGGAGAGHGPARAADPRHGHGLAVAAGTAVAHGGMLGPPCRVGDGSTVATLTLPVAESGRDG